MTFNGLKQNQKYNSNMAHVRYQKSEVVIT